MNDDAIVRQLVAKHLNLVYRIVKDLGIKRYDPIHEDAVQAGLERLVCQAQRYDSTRSVPFASYAWPAVSGGIKDLLSGQQLVHEPIKKISSRAKIAADFSKMTIAERELMFGVDDQGNANEPERIYRGDRIPLDSFASCRQLDVPLELTTNTEDAIIASLDATPDQAEALSLLLDQAMTELSPAQHETLVLALQGHSHYEIAEMLGVTRSAVQQRLQRAIRALREAHGFKADGSWLPD